MEKDTIMKKIIAFSKFNVVGLIISLALTSTLVGVTVFRGGFNLGIDFRSGQSITASVPSAPSAQDITDELIVSFPQVVVTEVNNFSDKTFNIKIASTSEEQEAKLAQVQDILRSKFTSITILSTSFIGADTFSKSFTIFAHTYFCRFVAYSCIFRI